MIPAFSDELKDVVDNDKEEIEYVEPGISTDHVFNIDEEISDEAFPDENPTFTVNNNLRFLSYYWGNGNNLQMDNAPIYFDQSDYEGKSFFFSDFSPNETKETHLVYAVDEDKIDNAYIRFEQSGTTSFVGNYIKVTK